MVSSIATHGVKAAQAEIREWLAVNLPIRSEPMPHQTYATEKWKRRIATNYTIQTVRKRARIPLKWRVHFAELWHLPLARVAEITNLIVEDMEKALVDGSFVSLPGIGVIRYDLKQRDIGLKPKFKFFVDPGFAESLRYATVKDPGVKHRVSGAGRLIPR